MVRVLQLKPSYVGSYAAMAYDHRETLLTILNYAEPSSAVVPLA